MTGRCGIYARPSSSEKSCDAQVGRLTAIARALGWDPVVFRDDRVVGSTDNRPALDALRAAVRRRELDLVLVARLDRLGGSLLGIRRFWEDAELAGASVVVVDQGLDSRTPAGGAVRSVLAAIAEFERELIQERTRVRVEQALRGGPRDPTSRASRGTRGFGRPREVPDDIRQIIVERAAGGATPKQIAVALKLKRSTVRSIIQAAKSPQRLSVSPPASSTSPTDRITAGLHQTSG